MEVSSPAAGALYSTTGDLFLWDLALSSNLLINEKTEKRMSASHVLNVGHGWMISSSPDGKTAIVHDVVITGLGSLIVRLVESDPLTAILSDCNSSSVQPVAFGINGILAHAPYSPAEHSAEDIILDELKKNGIEKAKERFKKLPENQDVKAAGSSLNTIGYWLIEWDSLAEGHMKKERKNWSKPQDAQTETDRLECPFPLDHSASFGRIDVPILTRPIKVVGYNTYQRSFSAFNNRGGLS